MIPEYTTPRRIPPGTTRRYLVRFPFISVWLACLYLWFFSYQTILEIGQTAPTQSWSFRLASGRLDFIRTNYSWPTMNPGWHYGSLYFDRQLDLNFLFNSPGFLGLHWNSSPTLTFGSFPLYLPTAISFLAMLLIWHRTHPPGTPLVHPWLAARLKNHLTKSTPLNIMLFIILLVILLWLVAVMLPSEARS